MFSISQATNFSSQESYTEIVATPSSLLSVSKSLFQASDWLWREQALTVSRNPLESTLPLSVFERSSQKSCRQQHRKTK